MNRDGLSNVKIGQDYRDVPIWVRGEAGRYVLRVHWGHGFMLGPGR